LGAVLAHAVTGRLTVDHEVLSLDRLPDGWERQAQGRADRRIVVEMS
jgi:hypothetical protein